MAHRYFTQNIANDIAVIKGADAAHLVKVLRLQIGEELTICDGYGFDYTAKVNAFTQDEVFLQVLNKKQSLAEPTISVEIYVGYAKGDKLELVIQKAVELGASAIHPFFSANCVVKPKKEEEKNKRYNRIALEAAKQAGRGLVPKVGLPLAYAQMLKQAAKMETALFLYEKGGESLKKVAKASKSFAIITGAEGGFTPEEADAAQKAGCTVIGLGARILRCETAPIAVLSALMCLSGNLE